MFPVHTNRTCKLGLLASVRPDGASADWWHASDLPSIGARVQMTPPASRLLPGGSMVAKIRAVPRVDAFARPGICRQSRGRPASNRCVGVCACARIVAEMSPRGGLSEVLYLLSKGLESSGFPYQKGGGRSQRLSACARNRDCCRHVTGGFSKHLSRARPFGGCTARPRSTVKISATYLRICVAISVVSVWAG